MAWKTVKSRFRVVIRTNPLSHGVDYKVEGHTVSANTTQKAAEFVVKRVKTDDNAKELSIEVKKVS